MKSDIEKLAKAITKFIDKYDSGNQDIYRIHFNVNCYEYKKNIINHWSWIIENRELASSYLEFADDKTITIYCEDGGTLADLVHDRGNPFVDFKVLKKFDTLLEKYGYTYWSYDYYIVLITLE